MACNTNYRANPPLFLAVPEAVRASATPPGGNIDYLFEGSIEIEGETYPLLRLHCEPLSGYTKKRVSEAGGLQRHSSGVSYGPSRKSLALTLKLGSIPLPVLLMLQEVVAISDTSASAGTPQVVTLIDYAGPERADIAASIQAETLPSTIRQGVLKMGEIGPLFGLENQQVLSGVTLEFEQVALVD